MNEDSPPITATTTAGGKKARRGRRQDDTLPPSRSRDVQRAFRARRAAHLTHLEAMVDWLYAENLALRQRCGLPEDGPPLTGPAPVEEIIEGPTEALPAPVPKKGKGKASTTKGGKKGGAKDENSEGEGRLDEDCCSPMPPRDEARGAAEVLTGGGGSSSNTGNPNNGLPLPPMTLPPSSSTSISHTGQGTLALYSLPQQQQPSPRMQSVPTGSFQPHPSHLGHLVNHPHASVSYPHQPLPAYAQSPYPNAYQSFPPNGAPPYNSYYPHPQFSQQQYLPHPTHQPQNQTGPFAMSLPPHPSPSNTMPHPYPPTHPPSLSSSQRNSVSSAASPQSSTPPSSHLRVSTVPTPAPPPPHSQQHQQQPHVYPALVPSPSSITQHLSKPPSSTSQTFQKSPLMETHHSNQHNVPQQQQQQQEQQAQDELMFNSIFPTPSPEDEQFFLDTFCGLQGTAAHENLFLQSLYPPMASSYLPPQQHEEIKLDDGKGQELERGQTEAVRTKEEQVERDTERRSRSKEDAKQDARNYTSFCIGLMKGVKGIEGLIAQKRKRDREQSEHEPNKKRRRMSSSKEERQEKEDETVAFLAEAAAMASSNSAESKKDRDCCEGIIDCGPPRTDLGRGEGNKKQKDAEGKAGDGCCAGLIDCDAVDEFKPIEEDRKAKIGGTAGKAEGGEDCCSGLISCEQDRDGSSSKPLTSPPASPRRRPASHASLPPPPPTIYLPRSSSPRPLRSATTTDSSNCCGPNTSCTVDTPIQDSEKDAYILVSLAFTELSPYMTSTRPNSPARDDSEPDLSNLTPTRIAELLYNDKQTSSPSAANLIIVSPSAEEEARGKKGELYVRKGVVEQVKEWCAERRARD
ncbi:hypothetical protein JCM16303_006808 [Sporobolomyces ruberrimus]